MIRNFADKETENLFSTGQSRRRLQEIRRRAMLRLTQLDAAIAVEDLRLPPSNRLEALSGERQGQWGIRINDRWRLCFLFANGTAGDVEIVDYH